MRRGTPFACLLVALAAAVAYAEGEKVTIRHAWPAGKYVMTVTNQTEGTTTVAGNNMPTKDRSRLVWQLDVPAGHEEKKVTLRLREAMTEGEEDGEAYRFDSARSDPKEGELPFIYKPLMGTSISVTLDADDTIVEAFGLDALWGGLGEKAQTPGQKSLVGEYRISLGDKFFESNFRRLESIAPRDPVAPGDAWKAGLRLDLPLIGEIKARYECKLKAVENGEAVVEATSKYNLSNPKTIEMEGASLTLANLEMEEQATLRFNLQTGLVTSDETTRTVTSLAKTTQDNREIEIANKSVTRSTTTFAPAGKEPAPTTAPAGGKATPAPEAETGNPPAGAMPNPLAAGATPAGLPQMAGNPNAAPPPWIQEGVRVVYYVASGYVPGAASYYRDDQGDWRDAQGNRYSQTPTSGGNGYSQIDILGVEGPAVIASIRSWSLANGTGPVYPIGSSGYVFAPGESEWWMNPAALRDLPTTPLGELKIVRGPYKILRTGKVFENTVVIRCERPDSRIQHVYDAQTGMLLHIDSMVRQRDGSQGVGRIDFVALRTVKLPWLNAGAPDWFGQFNGLALQGARTVQVPNVPTSAMPTVARVAVARKGNNWALLKLETSTQLPGGATDSNQAQVVSGPNQVGGFWIHPDVLRGLQSGQVLDQDEAIGTRVEVGPIGNGLAVISEIGPAHNYSFGYDLQTGMLAAEALVNEQTHTRVDLQRVQRSD